MKVLEITKSVEESIKTICDMALKSAGINVHDAVNRILTSIESELEDKIKVLEIDTHTDQTLHLICDTALKFAGMQVHRMIQELITSVTEK